jgi:hypothetical protein
LRRVSLFPFYLRLSKIMNLCNTYAAGSGSCIIICLYFIFNTLD